MSIELELIMNLLVETSPTIEIGQTLQGNRRVIPISGGSFEGPLLKGIVLAGGADWNMAIDDFTSDVWARYTLQTDDGTNIMVTNKGYLKAEQIEGQDVTSLTYARTVVSFEVGQGKYNWLNNKIFVGTLELVPNFSGVKLQFFLVK